MAPRGKSGPRPGPVTPKAAPAAPVKPGDKATAAAQGAPVAEAAPTVAWPADKVERWALERLTPYAKNARTHSAEQVGELVASIQRFGFTVPVLVDEKGLIIAGHGRVLAAGRLGLKTIPVMVAAGWTEVQKRAYTLADNKLALNAGWDLDLLRGELVFLGANDVDLGQLGFHDTELVTFLAKPSEQNPDVEVEPPKDAVSRVGDLWQLGRHRLLCGDATKTEDVTRALDGARPHLMVTDPPYGVNYDPLWREAHNRFGAKKAVARGVVENDDQVDWTKAWELFAGDVAYVWHGHTFSGEVKISLASAGFEPRTPIVWAKQTFTLSRGDYHWQHEACWYAVRKGKPGRWASDRKQTTVWNFDSINPVGGGGRGDDKKIGHGTQKPVEAMARPMRNNSKPGDFVYEPFAGSSTTIIAAEMLNRQCRAIELMPAYVDMGVMRWQQYASAEATLAGDGGTFAEIAKARGVKPASQSEAKANATSTRPPSSRTRR